MRDFEFENRVELNSQETLQTGFFLWIWYADKIPPHIGCSMNGRYFSLKVNGKDDDMPVLNTLQIIRQKKIPAIFIKVNSEFTLDIIKESYSKFQNAASNSNTCLRPITIILNCSESVFKLSELLIYLQEKKQIESVFGLNLADDYIGIPSYSFEDIENRLWKLENAKSQKYIPPFS